MNEVEQTVRFSEIRYAQCWEDADVLREGLNIQPGEHCLSIASAGDNTLALLLDDPAEITAVDFSPAQLACLELRIAAYRHLDHAALLELIGSRPSTRRQQLYQSCRECLSDSTRTFWDAHAPEIEAGIGSAGKFERYFASFRKYILPLIHGPKTVNCILRPQDSEARKTFYDQHWNSLRWRALFRIFFSRKVMGRLGRDPAFFKHVEGSVADRILARTRHALRELDPSENPYLYWILKGTHGEALPCALREENFECIRTRVDRVRLIQGGVENALDQKYDRYNLSDLFEYLSPAESRTLLEKLAGHGVPGGRLFYWNMLAPRSAPSDLQSRLKTLPVGENLLKKDKAWFYSRIVVEEIQG